LKIALIDADILVYEASFKGESAYEWEPGEFTYRANLPLAQEVVKVTVSEIIEDTGADGAVLVLSDRDRDRCYEYRRRQYAEYKYVRKTSRKPLVLDQLTAWLPEEFEVVEKPGLEGDDTLGILATGNIKKYPGEKVICSIDKDMLTVAGEHYNWRSGELFVVTEEEANYNHMIQTLAGDRVDGFPGCPGIGPKRAEKILADWTTPADRWHAVCEAFDKRSKDVAFVLSQARCARILRACDYDFKKKRPIPWVPEREEN
jgi:DNA polymerase-1